MDNLTEPPYTLHNPIRKQTIGGGIVAVLIFGALAWLFRAFSVDDVYITFRFVKQWNAGNGLVYNAGDYVEGYSNFLWVAGLALLDHIDQDLMISAKWAGAALGLMTLVTVWHYTRTWYLPWAAPLLLASTPAFAAWSVSGLETPLFTFLLLVTSLVFIKEEKHQQGWLSGILLALLALTRPEGLMFGAVATLYRAAVLLHTRLKPVSHDYLRLLSWLLPVGLYFLWRWQYYGEWLPNTMAAKSMGLHIRAMLEGVYYLYGGINAIGGLFVIGLPLAALLARWRFPAPVVLFLALVLAQWGFMLISGGDWMPFWRFWVHVLPLLYLLLHAGLASIRQYWPMPAPVLPILILAQAVYLLVGAVDARAVQGIGAGEVIPPPDPQVAYLMQHIEPDDTIAVIDAGRVAYELPLTVRIVDMVGLTDRHIAHRRPQFPGGIFGRGDAFGKWDVQYVLEQKPRFVQVNIVDADTVPIVTNFTGTTLLVNDPTFRHEYIPVDPLSVAGLYVRQEQRD